MQGNDVILGAVCFVCFQFLLLTGCKEIQFYGLRFGQVVASVCYPKSLLSSPTKFLVSSIDYSSCVI